jgi:hypothetical protein
MVALQFWLLPEIPLPESPSANLGSQVLICSAVFW